ncbi:hypothetical protein [Actinomadura sp. 3N508]|uniref:hypothetical protein n=1 Tax=Actinomadura sp. 3N508 TaxID=3375153 RepID=UPI0037BCD368
MTVEAKSFRRIRPYRLGQRQGAVVLRLTSSGQDTAFPGCSIDGETVPGGWGNWYYRTEVAPHRITLNSTPPVNIDVDLKRGSLSDLTVEYYDLGPVPYAVQLTRQPRRLIYLNFLSFLYMIGIIIPPVLLAGGLILLGRAIR